MPFSKIFTGDIAPVSLQFVTDTAQGLGVQTAALRAVLEVECRGSGFYQDGRLTMLYEPHIAYRYATSESIRSQLVKERVGSAGAGVWPYPPTANARYIQFNTCAEIGGIELACKACSWGLPQGMGFNFKPFGYKSAREMVEAFSHGGEQEQLNGMARFIRANKTMHTALRNLNWAIFAKTYNGSNYAINRYDTRLANSYLKFRAMETASTFEFSRVLRKGSKGNDVKTLQKLLIGAGYPVDVDGDYGRITEQEIKTFQRRAKLVADGIAGNQTFEALMRANNKGN